VGFAEAVMILGLVFGMISIKMMSMLENAQIVVVKGVRVGTRLGRKSRPAPAKKIVAFAMGTHKIFFLRIGILFFTRISSLIFAAEAMYPEKLVEGAALTMMKTVMISSRIRAATVRKGKHAIRKIRVKNRSKSSVGPKK
jgi:hypothetical protein